MCAEGHGVRERERERRNTWKTDQSRTSTTDFGCFFTSPEVKRSFGVYINHPDWADWGCRKTMAVVSFTFCSAAAGLRADGVIYPYKSSLTQ